MVKISDHDVDATGSLRDPSGVEASSVCTDGCDCALSAANYARARAECTLYIGWGWTRTSRTALALYIVVYRFNLQHRMLEEAIA